MFNKILKLFRRTEETENRTILNSIPEAREKFSENLKCVACGNKLDMSEVLPNVYCFGGNAIVFGCPHCDYRQYFYPYDDFIEVGALGSSPVVDPIPVYKYKIALQHFRHGQIVEINYCGYKYIVPSSLSLRDGAKLKVVAIEP